MFEKEAEEYVKETYCSKCWQKEADGEYACTGLDYCGRYKDFQKGAESREKRIEELEAQIEEMKKELHHRLVSPAHGDSDCLDKIVGLDRLWQFGQEF